MPTPIKPSRSYNEDWVPSTVELVDDGWVGVNGVTGKIWMRDDDFNIKEVGGIYDGASLPRVDPGIAGAFWNDDGVLKVSNG